MSEQTDTNAAADGQSLLTDGLDAIFTAFEKELIVLCEKYGAVARADWWGVDMAIWEVKIKASKATNG